MIINTDVETFIWVYVSSSLKFITVHTKPGIRHNTSEVTWWDLNPESWQIMIKDYSPLMCLYPRYLCLASWKQGYIGDFISSIISFRLVRLTQWVSDSFLTAPACCCCSSLKIRNLCVCFNLSLQCRLLWRGLQRSEWCSWRLCCDLCCCGFHRNETTVGRRQSGRKKMTSPSPTHSDSSGSSKHDSNQVCGHCNVQYVSFC